MTYTDDPLPGTLDPSSRARYNRIMRWIRRIHMYLGLLPPGVTGFLFSHGQVLAPYDIRVLPTGWVSGFVTRAEGIHPYPL